MSDAATARTDLELQMLESLIDCAHALSSAVGQAAMAEANFSRQLELMEVFQRSFQSVRMGIRLALTLRAGPRPVAAAPSAARVERETEQRDAERPDRDRREREREREFEAVSLPSFLKSLGVVSAEAARLDNLPAQVRDEALPALQRLLAQADADAAPAQPSPFPPKGGVDLLLRPPKVAPRRQWLGTTARVLPPPFPRAGPPPRRSG